MTKRVVASIFAGTMLLAIPAPAAATPTCPHGAVVVTGFPTGVNPDRNANGAVCERTVGPNGRSVVTDDRDV